MHPLHSEYSGNKSWESKEAGLILTPGSSTYCLCDLSFKLSGFSFLMYATAMGKQAFSFTIRDCYLMDICIRPKFVY